MIVESYYNDILERNLKEIKDCFSKLEKQNFTLKNQLEEWNKDQEIEKYKKQAEDIRIHSLQYLTDNELKEIESFKKNHYARCAAPLQNKAKGDTYIYTITNTGLGAIIQITCPLCGETKDITDTDSW